MSAEDERAVLGAALAGPGGHAGVLALSDDDWFDRRHREIAHAVRGMLLRRRPVTTETVSDELALRNKLATSGGATYLADLLSNAPVAAMGEYFAERVRIARRVTVVRGAAENLLQSLRGDDAHLRLPEIVTAHQDAIATMPGELHVDEEPLPTVARLLAKELQREAWLIPGLLERQERVMITGGEGHGKSTLLKQIAVCCSAGLNPFNGQRVADGMRVLYVDAELSELQNQRAYSWIKYRTRVHPLADPGWVHRLNHFVRNDGVDLAGKDREWFHHIADRVSPDLIVVGPVYKLMDGDESDSVVVAGLQRVLDEVRVKHNAALIIEAHTPHGTDEKTRPLRPVGSSLWRRWPEIGFGFRRDESEFVNQLPTPDHLEVVSWRGQRDARDWPELICYGDEQKELPWVPTRPDWKPTVNTSYTIPEQESA